MSAAAKDLAPASPPPATLPDASAAPLAAILSDPERLQAIPVETVERLLALKERMDAEYARKAFFEALAAFQAECPIIERRKGIPDRDGNVKYRYAPLEQVIAQVAPLLRVHGLAYRFDTMPKDGGIEVQCILTHALGHSETSVAFMPGVQVPKANAAQNAGAGITYGKRIAFLNATGILTADMDSDGDDGSGAGADEDERITADQAANLRALAEEVGADEARFLKWMQVESFEDIAASRYEKAARGLEAKRQ